MTTIELFHRIGRRAKGGDFTALSMTEQTDIAEAANAAMQECYNALPTYFKELTEGFLLPKPYPLSLDVTAQSPMVSSGSFTDEQLGRSVVIDGDAAWNQIISTDRLLNPYLGATGTVNATVYGDAVYSNRYPIDRIIGNPMFANQTNPALFRRELARSDQGAWTLWQQSIGLPAFWWPQFLGNSQGNEPLMVMRFAPAPSIDYSINCRISYWPKRLTLADYDAATTIYVPNQFLEKSLIPLALRAFMSSPAWELKGDETRIDARAEQAEIFLKNQPGQPAAPNNRIFCPLGF